MVRFSLLTNVIQHEKIFGSACPEPERIMFPTLLHLSNFPATTCVVLIFRACTDHPCRLTFRESLHTYITRKVPQSLAIEKAMVKEGWRLVALLRVAPVVPDSLLNYILCVTSIRFDVYAATSAVCLLPYVALYVYLGSASSDIWQTVSGGGDRSNVQVAVAVMSTLAGVLAVGYIVVVVKRTLKQVLDEEGGGVEEGVGGSGTDRGMLFVEAGDEFSAEASPLLGGEDRSRGRRDN